MLIYKRSNVAGSYVIMAPQRSVTPKREKERKWLSSETGDPSRTTDGTNQRKSGQKKKSSRAGVHSSLLVSASNTGTSLDGLLLSKLGNALNTRSVAAHDRPRCSQDLNPRLASQTEPDSAETRVKRTWPLLKTGPVRRSVHARFD